MPYDEHEQNLRKLERAAAQAKATQSGLAGGILTQMNQGGQDVGYGGGNQGGRGRDVGRMAPIQDDHSDNGGGAGSKKTYGGDGGGNDKNGGPAPGVSNQLQKRAIQSKRDAVSDDEFADADIDDLWAD